MNFFKNLRMQKKFLIFSIIPLIGFIALGLFELNKIHDVMLESKKQKTRNLVEAAHSIAAHFHAENLNGNINQETAQALAINAIKNMRYDETEYFWINDMRPYMVMHPYKPELDGKDLSQSKDPNGTYLFNEMVQTVTESGSGYVNYMWPKAGEDKEKTFPKLSFVKGFAPWNWVIGSGIYIDDIEKAYNAQVKATVFMVLIIMTFISTIAYLIARNIVKPVKALSADMRALANDEMIDITNTDRKDEIGEMAEALLYFKDKTIAAKKLENEQKMEQIRKEQKQKMLSDAALEFENYAKEATQSVASAAHQLSTMANAMVGSIGNSISLTSEAANMTDETSSNVSGVASAAEEMSASVEEIVSQIHKTNNIITDTVNIVNNANTTSNELKEAAGNIQQITSIISDIAEQINLLALNATIEAARAGDAGKGFAVVASEVKNLANQTAQATANVEHQVSTIQNISESVSSVLNNITKSVHKIEEYSSTMAAAMDEQTAVTSDISRNMQSSSMQISEVKMNMNNINQASLQSQKSAEEVLSAAQNIALSADDINNKTKAFLETILK
jgi:methyl-accepting chemotaxis protein